MMVESDQRGCDDSQASDIDSGLAECMDSLRELASTAIHASEAPPQTDAASRSSQTVGQYVLLDGLWANVFKAWDNIGDRFVTLHLCDRNLIPERGSGTAPPRTAAAALEHAACAKIHSVGVAGEWGYVATEFVDGESLADRMLRGPVAFSQGAKIIASLARALAHAHDRHVVLGCVAAENIRVDLTSADAQYRFATYAPESLVHNGRADAPTPAADIYALGEVLYQLLTGSDEPGDRRELPRAVNGDIPRDLETICITCLATRPCDRYASAAELADELDRVLADLPIKTGRRAALRGFRGSAIVHSWTAAFRRLTSLFGRDRELRSP